MAKSKTVKPKAETRNLSVYKDDYDFFTEAADRFDRSRIRMFRYMMSQLKDGGSVSFTNGNGKGAKR
jgi:hypothetical protein